MGGGARAAAVQPTTAAGGQESARTCRLNNQRAELEPSALHGAAASSTLESGPVQPGLQTRGGRSGQIPSSQLASRTVQHTQPFSISSLVLRLSFMSFQQTIVDADGAKLALDHRNARSGCPSRCGSRAWSCHSRENLMMSERGDDGMSDEGGRRGRQMEGESGAQPVSTVTGTRSSSLGAISATASDICSCS